MSRDDARIADIEMRLATLFSEGVSPEAALDVAREIVTADREAVIRLATALNTVLLEMQVAPDVPADEPPR